MPDRLILLVCAAYFSEAEALRQTHAWADVKIQAYLPACMQPNMTHLLDEQLERLKSGKQPFVVVGNCPVVRKIQEQKKQEIGITAQAGDPALVQCFYNILNKSIVDHYIEQRSYLVTSGWLDHWEQHLSQWGFDQDTARAFFGECVQKIVLLDTGINPAIALQLERLGDYLAMPVAQVPVGLDYFDLYLAQLVDAWRVAKKEKKNQEEKNKLKRNLANYAMMFEMMPVFPQQQSEEELIVLIVDTVQMLFSPGAIDYVQVKENGAITRVVASSSPEEIVKLENWVHQETVNYELIQDNRAFYLRLQNQRQTVGALCVAELAFPQYIHQYYNLAISMASICGLAIMNARILQLLKEAEELMRHEKEISETFCQVMVELTSRVEQDEMHRRILESLSRVIPFTDAAIFILNDTELNFQIGLACDPNGGMVPYKPTVSSLQVDLAKIADPVRVLTNLAELPGLEKMLSQPQVRAWMGIPLRSGGRLLGFLSVVGPNASAYGKHEIILAQSFANAIEGARIFKEAVVQASTDPLTHLLNRRSFFERASHLFQEAALYSFPLAVLMIDVDKFKLVNDTYGHDIGDLVLVKIADLFVERIRAADVLGRYGGEEFVLILPLTAREDAEMIAERLRYEIGELQISTEKGGVQVKVSVGIACLDSTCPGLEQLMKRSDEAMYRAKQLGRNRVVTWTPDLSLNPTLVVGFDPPQPRG